MAKNFRLDGKWLQRGNRSLREILREFSELPAAATGQRARTRRGPDA